MQHHCQTYQTFPEIMDNYHLLRCFKQKDYKFPYNISEFTNSSSIQNVTGEPKAIGLCTVVGIFIVFVTDILLRYEFNMLSATSLEVNIPKIFNAKTLLRTIVLTFLVLLFPLISVFLLVLLIYRELCSVIIKKKDARFVSLLDSFDVFWSLEDDTTKSIINVLGVIESDSPFAIADKIKLELDKVTSNETAKKIFYRRNEAYGFYYWRRYSKIDMNQYVEVVELPQKGEINNVENLENLMSDLQEQPLPYQDKGLFKILITRQRIGNVTGEKGDYGIIIRVHHSVGDGVALIEFLCGTFADKTNDNPVNIFSLPETCNSESPSTLVGMMRTLLEMPICFIDDVLRKPDTSRLHGPALTGKKLFKWTESDENLLKLVKEIKNNADELNFSEVLLAALSSGLRSFLERVPPIPEDVGVILPIRFPNTSANINELVLKSNFSVTIFNLPVKEDNLIDIKNRCNELRKSADPLVNKYFLELLGRIFPIGMLKPLLYSDKATLIFSNMPGPKELTLCGGNALKSMVFFVPNKGTTGLGITSLSYGGVLRFAVIADQAVVSRPEDLALILDGIVDEIKRLHRWFVK